MNDKKVLLMILDGFGISEKHEHNAVFLAKKPHLDRLMKSCPHSLISTSGKDVGLPSGIMGNSEVGHLNMGSGRIVKQEISKIADFALERGFESLPDVKRVLCEKTGALHLIGLLSDGSVHSHEGHLFLLLKTAARVACKRPIFIHVITDGRDTPPRSALTYIANLERVLSETKIAKIATVSGRFYTMDRDKRWERTQISYEALTGSGSQQFPTFENATEAVKDAYLKNENDEFIKPRLIAGGQSMQKDDAMIFFNFRADRTRQLCRALAIPDFSEFPTPVKLQPQNLLTFTQYDEKFPFPVLFPPTKIQNILGEIVASHGDKQLRIAETEKYAHVTYFFNGGEEKPSPGEERVMVPSPRDVATYDLKPEMSAETVTDQLFQKMEQTTYRMIVLNYANSDMVGHTGIEPAAIKAVEVLDHCIGRVCEEAKKLGYDLLITADHGNSECMVDPFTGAPHTAHTTNPVPLIWVPAKAEDSNGRRLSDGILADVAPTMIDIFGWKKPPEMTGHSLIRCT